MKDRIGIVGGGQLGKMLALAAKKMGFRVFIIDPTPQSPAGQVSDFQIVADFKDEKAIRRLAKMSDFLTFEVELANSKILDNLSKNGIKVNPNAKTLTIIKDKLLQKKFLKKAGIPVADFFQVQSKKDILKISKKIKYPFLLKARFDAYDGRGNYLVQNEKDIDKGLEKLKGKKIYVEKFSPFVKELAIQVARSLDGETKAYPVVETIHKNNICHIVIAPAPVNSKIFKKAGDLGIKVMRRLKGAGVFGIEMFLLKNGKVLVNEIAPRVHNSGHYTIEGNTTSQFEQHIRAITGLPLGETKMIVPSAVMINILGERKGLAKVEGLDEILKIPNASVHIYGKLETRLDRKMGHITVVGKNRKETLRKAKLAREFISI